MPSTVRKFTSSGDLLAYGFVDKQILVAVANEQEPEPATLEPVEAAELGLWLLRQVVPALPADHRVSAGALLDQVSRAIGVALR